MVRPFSAAAHVHCRGYSLPLQRVITDFGADVPFGQIPAKLRAHHGIGVPASSAQAITQQHTQQVLQTQLDLPQSGLLASQGATCLIVELDGSMVPLVTTHPSLDTGQEQSVDRRTTRQLSWQEARLGLACTPEQTQPIFAATLGTTDSAGQQLAASARRVVVSQKLNKDNRSVSFAFP